MSAPANQVRFWVGPWALLPKACPQNVTCFDDEGMPTFTAYYRTKNYARWG